MEQPIKQLPREPKYSVVAINILVMVAYTLYLRYAQPNGENIIIVAILIFFHLVACLIAAIFIFRKEFLLSAALVLVIGFSTCMVAFAN